MKKTLKIIFSITIIASCTSSKKFTATGTNEEIIQQAVSVLKKHPGNSDAKRQLKINYEEAVKIHEDKIREIKRQADSNYLERILPELNALQNLNTTISPVQQTVKDQISSVNYADEIMSIKQTIAAESYDQANSYLSKGGWGNSKNSYNLFLKSNYYIDNYKGSKKLIKETFDKNIVNVVINPEGISPNDSSMSKVHFNSTQVQKKLIKDLGGDTYKFDTRIPAKFYSDADAKSKNIEPDWVINLRIKNLGFSHSNGLSFTDERMKDIKPGSDVTPESHASEQTRFAQVNVTQREYSMNATVEYSIVDVRSNKVIGKGELPASYEWQNQYAKYSGDYRALDRQDWELINESKKSDGSSLRTEKLVAELFEDAYPNLHQVILYFVKW